MTCIEWYILRKVQGLISIERPSLQIQEFPNKDKLVSLPSYLYNGNAYTVKTTFLSWDGPWFLCIIWENGITAKHIKNIYTKVFFIYLFKFFTYFVPSTAPKISTDLYQLNHYFFILEKKPNMWSLNTTVITKSRLTQLRSNQGK